MTLNAQSTYRAGAPDAKRNFILQQGVCEPAAGTCLLLYSALRFQPWVVGSWGVVAAVLQAPFLSSLSPRCWWSALAPHLNPFDALYNWTLARSSGIALPSAPAPRRFAQFLAGSFAIAIGLSLVLGWRVAALVLEGFFIVAIAALLFGGFCFGSFVFHLLCGRADFARRTLPWATGA
jgi:Domain of unknown function (DUF4395)